jgi:hypothetical protein
MGTFSSNPTPAPQPTSKSVGQANRQLMTDLSILKPQYFEKFIEKYGTQNYTMMLEYLGNKAVVPSRTFRHFESKGKLHAAVKVAAAGGDTVVDGGSVITLAASQNPVRVGEVVESSVTGNQFIVTVVTSATSITVKPLSATQGSKVIANNEWLLFRGIAVAGEASTSKANLNGDIIEIANTTTEIREDFSITDRAKIEELWFEANGQAFYTYKGLDEAVRRFNNNKEFSLMFGKKADLAGETAGTTGLISRIESTTNGGSVYQRASGTAITTAEFFDLARQIDFYGGGSEYHFLMDSFLRQYVDEELFAKYSAGAIQWGSVGGNQELAVKFGFDSIKIGGVTFHLKKYLPFNTESVYGVSQAGHKYEKFGILMPQKDGRDASNGDKVPSCRVIYNEVEKGQELKVWETGALAKTPTSDKMELNVHHMCYAGLQVFGANQFIIVK